MREIKFRAWDKKLKQIFYLNPNNYGSWSSWGDEIFPYCGEDGLFDLMQYTGLEDRNRVEIYEGDIIKGEVGGYWNQAEWVSYGFISFQVQWNKVGWFPFLLHPHEHGGSQVTLDPFSSEVIGNIYENPEINPERFHGKI